MRVFRFLALAAIVAALGCGGGDDDDGNPTGPPGGGATNGSFTAQVNGTAWSATGTITVSRQQNNYIGVAGTGFAGSTAYAFIVSIGNATGPGTHSFNLAAGGDGSSLIIGSSTTGGSAAGWGTAFNGGNGSVTITSLTSTRIVGTFTATAVSSSGSGGNLVITNGQFDVTY